MTKETGATDIVLAEDLVKIFNGFRAVDAISFSHKTGECLGLLGPNGAGKTSTIRMIYGFSPLSGGRLSVFGLDIRTRWREIRYHIGVCQQDNNLDPDLSVQKNLEVFARYFDIPRKKAREKADEILSFIKLDHRKDATVNELSGGMMRRLILGRALINDPRLLILDEPTTGLDPQSRHQVWEKLDALKRRGTSILLTTHYMEEASQVCDRVIIMDHGRILVQGSPQALIREHGGGSVIEVGEAGEALRGFVHERKLKFHEVGGRLVIYAGENERIISHILDRFCIEKCSTRRATLEDVFLRLTGRELRE
jgi:lipooligosaccharide transport system ATP-binding protein